MDRESWFSMVPGVQCFALNFFSEVNIVYRQCIAYVLFSFGKQVAVTVDRSVAWKWVRDQRANGVASARFSKMLVPAYEIANSCVSK